MKRKGGRENNNPAPSISKKKNEGGKKGRGDDLCVEKRGNMGIDKKTMCWGWQMASRKKGSLNLKTGGGTKGPGGGRQKSGWR